MAKRVFKTKKRLSQGARLFRKWAEWAEGDSIIGKFVSQGKDQYKKPSWNVEVYEAEMEDKKFAKSILEKTIGLNSNGSLDKQMEEVEIDDIVRVTYNGMSEIKGGPNAGEQAHTVSVEILEEDDGGETGEDDGGETGEDEEEELDEESEEEDDSDESEEADDEEEDDEDEEEESEDDEEEESEDDEEEEEEEEEPASKKKTAPKPAVKKKAAAPAKKKKKR